MAKGPVEKGQASGETTAAIAKRVLASRRQVEAVVAEAKSENKKVRNAAFKVLAIVAAEQPEWLIDQFDWFRSLLRSEQNVVKWNAADTVANLVATDDGRARVDASILRPYFAYLEDESMVTAAHGIDNLWKFALAQPKLSGRIADQLLRLAEIPREEACRIVLLAKAIDALYQMYPVLDSAHRKSVITFVRQAAECSDRTKKRAARFLKKYGPAS